MSTAEQHAAAARRHLKAFEQIVDTYADWGAVTLFYSALHLLEQAFAREGHHNSSHSEREWHIKRNCPQVWSAYHRLENESMKARYLAGGAFCLSPKSVRSELRDRHYRRIEEFVQSSATGT